MINKKNIFKERLLLIGIVSFFMTLLVLLAFSPVVLSQTRDKKLEEQVDLIHDVLEFVNDFIFFSSPLRGEGAKRVGVMLR